MKKYIHQTYTLPKKIKEMIDKLREHKNINKSAFVSQAIIEKIKREFPDFFKYLDSSSVLP